MSQRILVIEDDQSIAEIVGILLRAEGFEVSYCADGNQAITAFKAVSPDLVLLDLMLPGKDGIEICRTIRDSSGIPIVMLTARSDTSDIVTGLEAGADDYIVKPIKNEELLARIRARLRNIEPSVVNEITIGDLVID
ncbi:MAG: response regulator, partial [Actinobacteria bacterium]|nr:response regulator [Actinomycetota bacterium]